jgi:hypothetical protein
MTTDTAATEPGYLRESRYRTQGGEGSVASARHFDQDPGGLPAFDPLVTAQGDRLRLEVVSACNDVYARLDILEPSLDADGIGVGTAHVDIAPWLAHALGGAGPLERLRLHVGPEASDAAPAVRHAVALPERWLRALAETQGLACGFALRAELDGPQWQRFIEGLGPAGESGAGPSLWVLPGPDGLYQATEAGPGAANLPGAARLAVVHRLQHLVERVRIYGPDVPSGAQSAASAWEFELPGARFTLMFSPEPGRGFSGETVVPSSQGLTDDARTLSALLAWDAIIDVDALAAESRLSRERVADVLATLAALGQVGYDLHEQAWFHRPLPFDEDRVRRGDARLDSARALLASGAVSPVEGGWWVRGGHGLYRLTRKAGRLQCTCEFEARHRGARGPCRHALAVQLFSKLPGLSVAAVA